MKQLTKLCPAIASFLMMMAVATTSTALSFMNQPVSTQLQVGMGSFTLYYSLMVAAGAITTPFAGQLIHKLGVAKIVVATAVWGLVCMVLFSVSNALWMFYIVGILAGALGGSAITLIANVIVQTYYTTAEAASLIGIVMAGSGVGSILYSAVIPLVLEKSGIGMTYRFIGIVWVALLVLSVLILGKAQPVEAREGGAAGSGGMTRKEAMRSPMLYMMVFSVLLLTCGTGLAQHWPAVLEEQGYDAVTIGVIISFYSAVLTAGKIAQGILYGKAGIKRGAVIIYALYIVGFILLLNSVVYPAFLCIGLGFGILTTLVPVLTKSLFGQKEYAGIYGIIAMSMSVGSFITTPVWGVVYDTAGSYRPGFLVMPVLIAAALALQLSALRLQEKKNA